MPKLSIITVNLNNKNGLIDTAQSVVDQTWTDYEWIIIDGGSTDGSVEVIKEYAGKTDKLVYWCSEPDGGIYQGMNKGIGKANGEYCWFLNSGDCAYKNTTLEEIFANEFDDDIVYGDQCNKNHEDPVRQGVVRANKQQVSSPIYWVGGPAIRHQASFIKGDLFVRLGVYKTTFKVVSDMEFFINAIFNHNATTKYINSVFVNFDNYGVGSGSAEEYKKMLAGMFPHSYTQICIRYICLRQPIIWYNYLVLRIRRLGIKRTAAYYINRLFRGRK
jgi:glycosyltransferase involved in cell wall biosynthesis